jgi:hypothetical protein
MIGAVPEIRIGPATGALILSREAALGPPKSLLATLRLDGLEATCRVVPSYATGFRDLADFFAAMAADWRGWPDVRRWESLEGELAIDASHRSGRVVLKIHLRSDRAGWVNDGWRVTGDVTIDPGEQLFAAARDVALLADG